MYLYLKIFHLLMFLKIVPRKKKTFEKKFNFQKRIYAILMGSPVMNNQQTRDSQ